jgi:hypothetical protein
MSLNQNRARARKDFRSLGDFGSQGSLGSLVPCCLLACLLFLAACSPLAGTAQASPTFLPTEAQPTPTTIPFPTRTVDERVEDLVQVLEFSDPVSSSYDPNSTQYAEFPDVLKQLAALNAETNDAASMLGYALGFPRPDSILAARALISLGPDWAATDLPTLIEVLQNERPEIRMYSLIVLSITGDQGSCSLGNIGPLLWDADPYVRTSAALAIQGITGKELVTAPYLIDPYNLSSDPVAADTPAGKIVGVARTWWNESGSKVNWHPAYGLCDP